MMLSKFSDFTNEDDVITLIDFGVPFADEMGRGAFNNRAATEKGFPVAMGKPIGGRHGVLARDIDLRFGQHAHRKGVRFGEGMIARRL